MVPHRSEAETGLSHVATLRGTLPREPLPDDRPLGLELRQGLVDCEGLWVSERGTRC